MVKKETNHILKILQHFMVEEVNSLNLLDAVQLAVSYLKHLTLYIKGKGDPELLSKWNDISKNKKHFTFRKIWRLCNTVVNGPCFKFYKHVASIQFKMWKHLKNKTNLYFAIIVGLGSNELLALTNTCILFHF